ncbi:MAG: hypothetical protein IJA85_10510 [Clostridia bacterium]|nr:hypothetical protein [Clostridia bacterium]
MCIQKKFKVILISVLILSMLSLSISAQIPESISPYWVHTRRVILSHTYESGNAEFYVDIKGLEDVDSIQNVDIEFSVEIDDEWVLLASWNNLSVTGNRFQFEGTVPNVELGYTYRLSVYADVHRNGTIEWLTDYFDNTY